MNNIEACDLVRASLRIIVEHLNRGEEVTDEVVRKAFEDIAKVVKDEPFRRELGVDSLNRIYEVCDIYLHNKSEHRPLVRSILKVLGVAQKQGLAQEVVSCLTEVMKADQAERESQIQTRMPYWENRDPQQIREDMRAFIMSACTGHESFYRCSLSFLISEISKILPSDSPSQEILRNPELFSSLELKTGMLIPEGVPLDTAIKECVSAQVGRTVSWDQEIDPIVEELRRQRQFRLHNLTEVYHRVILQPDRPQTGNVKYFPQTEAWYVGTLQKDPSTAPFEIEMQQLGEGHQINVVTDSAHGSLQGGIPNVVLFDDQQVAAYPRDFVEFSIDEVRVPLVRHPCYESAGSEALARHLQHKRVERDEDWGRSRYEGHPISPPALHFGIVGEPWRKDLPQKAIRLALALKARPIMNLTYGEGGNTLIGTRENGDPYVIIRWDSYEASRFCLEVDLGRKISDDEIQIAFAIDYGVKKEDLYFVEQPGDFHLDMNLAIIGYNTIAVNDAVAAEEAFREDNLKWGKAVGATPKEDEPLVLFRGAQNSGVKKLFEDKTAEDLIRHGFQVERIAGRFDYRTPSNRQPAMNFFNMVTGKTPYHSKKIVVAMGVTDDKYAEQFKAMIRKENPDISESGFYFLNLEDSQKSLTYHGGIACRAKVIS